MERFGNYCLATGKKRPLLTIYYYLLSFRYKDGDLRKELGYASVLRVSHIFDSSRTASGHPSEGWYQYVCNVHIGIEMKSYFSICRVHGERFTNNIYVPSQESIIYLCSWYPFCLYDFAIGVLDFFREWYF